MVDLVLERYSEVKEDLQVSISGFGEPLLWGGIYGFLKELKNRDITTEMNSNATELTEESALRLIGNLDYLQVSLNVPNAELFRKHKNSDTYEKVKKNLELFFELKGNQKPITDLRFLKFPETEPLISQALREWGPMLGKGDAVAVAEFENWMGAIDESVYGVKYDKSNPKKLRIICADLFGKYLTITKEGNTYACCFAVALPPDYPTMLGNIKYYTIMDLLLSWKREAQYRAQYDGKYLHQCGVCSKIRITPPMTRYMNPDEYYE